MLVTLWLCSVTGAVVGVIQGNLVGLDRGWKADYTQERKSDNNSKENNEHGKSEKKENGKEDNGGQANGSTSGTAQVTGIRQVNGGNRKGGTEENGC